VIFLKLNGLDKKSALTSLKKLNSSSVSLLSKGNFTNYLQDFGCFLDMISE